MTAGDFGFDHELRGFDCGYGGPLRILSLLNLFQEAAGASAASLGFGMADLKAAGRTWMLSRLDMRIARLPREGERVTVRTRPTGTDRLFALRDLALYPSGGGAALARAVYAYLVVDLEARRPLRPERALPGRDLGATEHVVPDYVLQAEAAAGGLVRSFAATARPRHIDENGHVNNAYLCDWLVDAVPRAARGASGLAGLRLLRVEFLREVLEDEELVASAASLPDKELDGEVLLRSSSVLERGGEAVARAETGWSRV